MSGRGLVAAPGTMLGILLGACTMAAEPAALENMLGAYGPWVSQEVLGDEPGRLSFRAGERRDTETWRQAGRDRVRELMMPVDLGGRPEVRVDATCEFDGLHVERLSWQLPCGPRTEAVFLRPAGATGRLPAVLALHDHGGNKFLGWRKIARVEDDLPQIVAAHQQNYYEGAAWANELAKRGYAVLVPDAFLFGSRRVRVADVPAKIRMQATDPEIGDAQAVQAYNTFAGQHEHIVAKSLFSAGTTWPGMYVTEDQRASTCSAAGRTSIRNGSAPAASRGVACGRCSSAASTTGSGVPSRSAS